MKQFKVYRKDRSTLTVSADSIGKIMEGMVVLHAEDGTVAACFTVSDINGIVAAESIVKE